MKNKKARLLMRTAILVVFVAALVFALYQVKANKGEASEGNIAPDFVLPNLQGEKVQLSDFRGKEGVLVNFWGSWCEACKQEFPHIENVYKSGEVKNVEILAVDIGESHLTVKNFVDRYGLTMPVLLDKRKTVTDVYNIGPIPTTFLIDQNGRIVKKIIGAMGNEAQIMKYMKLVEPKN